MADRVSSTDVAVVVAVYRFTKDQYRFSVVTELLVELDGTTPVERVSNGAQ